MQKYKIRALEAGYLYSTPPEPVYFWYIMGGNVKAIVDAGLASPDVFETRWKTKIRGGGEETIIRELALQGVDPKDINYVILTHLHIDHAWNVGLFKNAQVIVQKEEIMHAIHPCPLQRGYYSRDINISLISRKQPEQLLIIEGDYEIAEGLEVVFTPGHTPGFQSVIVNTEKGRVGLCSDTGPTYRNWFPSDPDVTDEPLNFLKDSFLPDNIHTENINEYIKIMKMFFEKVDIIIPSHDPRIPKQIPEQWWSKPTKIESSKTKV